MFPGKVFLAPGKELMEFDVFKPEKTETLRGQVLNNKLTGSGKIKAVLAQASPLEIQRWKQLQHPISHKIIAKGAPDFEIAPGDILQLKKRRFVVRTNPYNIGGLYHFVIYYCQERTDT